MIRTSKGEEVLLSRLLDALPEARVSGPVDGRVADVVYRSQEAQPGSLFVAVPSVGGDAASGGSRFVTDAARRGASAVVTQVEQSIPGLTTVVVPDARAALADLAAAYYEYPSRSLQLFAITGTDGKTTTSYLLEQILSAAGYQTGLVGTVEIKVGALREANLDRMTTPESLDVQRLLRSMVHAGVTHAVVEASSHALALDRLRGCTFAACAVTNITGDHVEFHGSWDRYFAAKASLFTELGRGAPAILNADDATFERLSAIVPGPVLTYGLGEQAGVRATEIEEGEHSSSFVLSIGEQHASTCVALPGRFNVSNALCTAALASVAGLPVALVAGALSAAQPPPGRLQRVDVGQPFEVLVDYAHTVNAFRSVLAALRPPPPRRLIAVFGAAGNRDRAKRPMLARLAREYADFFIVTNEDPFDEEPEAIISEITAGVPADERGRRFEIEADRGRAIEAGVVMARPGDRVVILGKGHEHSIVVNGRKETWSDVAAARDALAVRR